VTTARNDRLLTRQLTSALATPIVLLLVLGGLLGFQLVRMSDDARWVDHTDEVIALANDTMTQILNQETALRGFLITEDRRFLQPYERANPTEELARLHAVVVPEQAARVEEAQRRHGRWLASAAPLLDGKDLAKARAIPAMLERKALMDSVRESMSEILGTENALRRDRAAKSAASTSLTKFLFVGMIGAAALILAFVSRRQLNAITLAHGDALERARLAALVLENEAWVRAGQAEIAQIMLGERTVDELATRCLSTLATCAGADVGAFFTLEANHWKRRAGFGLDGQSAGADRFAKDEGLVGRAAGQREPLHLKDVPRDFLKIRSGTGGRSPVEVALVPAWTDDGPIAVVEVGFLRPAEPRVLDLLGRVSESIAVAVRSNEYKLQLRDLLQAAQKNAEELQTQQEELRVANEELGEQGVAMSEAQRDLEKRQHELESTNARLEEQTNELTTSREAITAKSAEVERSSRYKSEFLANMSHELRTPLNSSLILAKLLSDNKTGNLTDEQVKFADTIYDAGNDLLALISDILDLSKIEAGKLEVTMADVGLARLGQTLTRTFGPMAEQKGLEFAVTFGPDAPADIESDLQRLEQVLKNLLSNAMKFTEKGRVSLEIRRAGSQVHFVVRDTGIGIALDHQASVFDAFRQVDAGTSRKYGGTGLGLSISREFALLLGGELRLESEKGHGSTFTLVLPIAYVGPAVAASLEEVSRAPALSPALAIKPPMTAFTKPLVEDDLAHLDASKRLVLVIEDDSAFGTILVNIAHELGFQCITAQRADEGYELARRHQPSAVLLDVGLPDHSGLSVLERLKRNSATRHIPVHVVSGSDHTQAALAMGAVGYMLKPVPREKLVEAFRALEERFSISRRRLLIVEDDRVQRDSLKHLLEGPDVEITGVGTVGAALEALSGGSFDCVVTDLSLPDASGFELLERMATDDAYSFPPVIVYTGRSLSAAEEQKLRRYSSSIIVKGARSPERLLDEVTLFLHQVEAELPPERQRMLKQSRDRETVFEERRILIVEDDVRNIFALTSLLEPKGAEILIARNGREALEVLEKNPDVDLVLMDIMMPEMDGHQAMREIRKQARWAKLPIIALTAKAMKDDQQKCADAGANDYVSKPLNVDMLLSLLRVWMPK
jgi:CheY-like chemotaxis protein/signal transduction histidine kinase